jgi:hypothetical protein
MLTLSPVDGMDLLWSMPMLRQYIENGNPTSKSKTQRINEIEREFDLYHECDIEEIQRIRCVLITAVPTRPRPHTMRFLFKSSVWCDGREYCHVQVDASLLVGEIDGQPMGRLQDPVQVVKAANIHTHNTSV